MLLAQPGEVAAEASGDFISTQYILDCVERNEKLELEAYRLGPAPAADQVPETKPGVQVGAPPPRRSLSRRRRRGGWSSRTRTTWPS